MNKIILPVILDSYRPRKDGSFSITLGTDILSVDQRTIIGNMYSQLCCVMLKDSGNATDSIHFSEDEKEMFNEVNFKEIDTKQSKSQRQRIRIWQLWNISDKKLTEIEYYNNYMDRIDLHLQSKLNQ